MSNKTKLGGLVAAAVLSFGLVGAASAATISWSDGSSPGANIAPTDTDPVVAVNVVGSVINLRKSPFEADALLFATAKYNSVGADASATYVFKSVRTALKLIWGSVDLYNYIEFYNGDNLVTTFSGSSAGDVFTENRPLTEILATIKIGSGFDKVVLFSEGDNAFEHSGVAAVPVPAAGFLLIGALGGLAALRRRKTAA